MANQDMAPDEGAIPVPTEEELQRLKRDSDQDVVSQQAIEQDPHLNTNEAVKAQGHIPLPAGERGDEQTTDDDDTLRADMVNAGD